MKEIVMGIWNMPAEDIIYFLYALVGVMFFSIFVISTGAFLYFNYKRKK